ncbi:hypothetical protein L3Y34_013561 [Caenorhabditis briggsae]|uniref:F-box domain-containing protein n=1 Tax=Caenorhabditis briggsae TaxID=6238 RepID=A0AAE8ZUC2_CAEBR|nr:hypothetical protein L3Y34_013561 [Caenorhabditis briggsae]
MARISLLALPSLVLRMTIREMSNGDIFHLSLVSKKSKKAVTSVMKKADVLHLCVNKDMVVTIQDEHQYIWYGIKLKKSEYEALNPVDIGNAELFEIQQMSKDGNCKICENLSPATLLNQLLYIYRRSEFDFIDIQQNAHLIDIQSVSKAIPKVGQLSGLPTSSTMHNQLILKAFPHVECLRIVQPLFLNGDDYHSAFTQNITRIELGKAGRTPVPFSLTLDHLLVSAKNSGVKTMKDIIENCVTSSNLTDFRLPVFSEPSVKFAKFRNEDHKLCDGLSWWKTTNGRKIRPRPRKIEYDGCSYRYY